MTNQDKVRVTLRSIMFSAFISDLRLASGVNTKACSGATFLEPPGTKVTITATCGKRCLISLLRPIEGWSWADESDLRPIRKEVPLDDRSTRSTFPIVVVPPSGASQPKPVQSMIMAPQPKLVPSVVIPNTPQVKGVNKFMAPFCVGPVFSLTQ